MEITLLLSFDNRQHLREWLLANHASAKECWVTCSRSKHPVRGTIPYIDIVEEALCFGWIDSTTKKLPDGRLAQRLSPRRKKSHWTQLNLQRCRDLIQKGLMTEHGLAVMPKDEAEQPHQERQTELSFEGYGVPKRTCSRGVSVSAARECEESPLRAHRIPNIK